MAVTSEICYRWTSVNTKKKPAPASRREKALVTRRRVLKAAHHVFCLRGYGATTMDIIAKEAGVDVERARRTMDAPEIDQALAANMELAHALGISGTPAFVVGNQLAPGAIDYEALKRLVAEARRGA